MTLSDTYTFFNAVHLKGEIIAYYFYFTTPSDNGHLAIQQLMNDDIYYIKYYNNYDDIIINKVSLLSTAFYNDFIKLNDYKLCIISLTADNKIYIITITLFNNDES